MKILYILLLLSLAGCATSFSGKPEKVIPDEITLASLEPQINPEAISRCMHLQTVSCRNDIVYASIQGADIKYSQFINDLQTENSKASVGMSVLTLGMTTAGAITGTSALSAVATAILGTQSTYNAAVLIGKSISSLSSQMSTSRAKAKIKLILGMQKPLYEYPLSLAILNIEEYVAAGTLIQAYTEINNSAGSAAAAANQELDKVLLTTYTPTSNSDRLRGFILDKDNHPIVANVKRLDDWLQINNAGIHTQSFISSGDPFIETLRQKAVDELINK